jgi:hypothetical protein
VAWPDWGLPAGCPAPTGTEAVTMADAASLRRAAAAPLTTEDAGRRLTDRAFWPALPDRPARPVIGPGDRTVVTPASESPYADLLRTHCGDEVLRRSLALLTCAGGCGPGVPDSRKTHTVWLRRAGVWLRWFES